MSVAPARRIALAALRRVREREAFGPETLVAVLRGAKLGPADTSLATRLTYGVLQTLGTLDDAIDRFSDRPERIEPGVRDALRLGAYELLFMRTPPRAAVHEGVEAVRAARTQAAGMGNAVLRKIAAAVDTFPWGDTATDEAALARATGHPLWLVNLWTKELGRERAVEALRGDLEPAPLYLWVNPFKTSFAEAMESLERDGAEPVPGPLPGSIRTMRPQAAVRSGLVETGGALITDVAAQVAPRALHPQPGETIVDVASGRGTKTAQLQAACVEAGGDCHLYSLDVHPFKAEVLQRRMRELGVPSVTALVGDALDLDSVEGLPAARTADAVLLDAPCSGLGALRRRPEKRWRVQPEDLERLSELQLALLTSVATLVRVGGRVVYSTCSVSRVENGLVVGSFLRRQGGRFRVGDLSSVIPSEWASFRTEEGYFQSIPLRDGPDGHFVALLERVS